jgi:ribosomal protein S27AE
MTYACCEHCADDPVHDIAPEGHELPCTICKYSPAKTIDAAHLERMREFSLRTFGPGLRTFGVIDHIAKEFDEIREKPDVIDEWVDVIILGLDGAQRTGVPVQDIIDALIAKQGVNEKRAWPDWRTAEPGQSIEHDRDCIRCGYPLSQHIDREIAGQCNARIPCPAHIGEVEPCPVCRAYIAGGQ